MSKKTNLNIRLIVLILFFTTVVEAIGGTYVFLPGQSTVIEDGGFAGIHETYTIEGRFQLTIDFDANTASFDHVDANLSEIVAGGYGQSLDDIFDMTDLVGIVVSDTEIEFDTADPMPGGKVVHLDLTFVGNSIHLTGGFCEMWVDGFCYTLDAVAGCVYYVDAVNGDDGNDGLTPEEAFASIQVGIEATTDGDTVIVADGTYVCRGNTNLDFAGRAITVRSKNGPELTIIDCQNDGRGFNFHSGEGTNSVLDGFTITNGYTDGSGGAIYCDGSSPTITNCALVANTANNGGAISCFFGNPTIMNCVITGNLSNGMCGVMPSGCGGAVSCIDSSPTITNCTISGNYANCGGGGIIAVALFTSDDGPMISNCILWNDTPEEIYFHVFDGAPLVTYCDVQGGWSGDGNNNIDADPCFVDANGPDGTIGTEDDNLRLSPDSPCIDAGDNDAVPADTADLDNDGNTVEPTPWDLDGRDRFVDGDCNDTEIVDMGAYEFTYAYLGDFDGSCDVNFVDYAILANYWLTDEFLVDIAPTPAGDGIVDGRDLDVLCDNWLAGF